MDPELFESDPRDFAMGLVEDHLVSSENMVNVLLKYMSHEDVRDALDANELSPRFDENEEA